MVPPDESVPRDRNDDCRPLHSRSSPRSEHAAFDGGGGGPRSSDGEGAAEALENDHRRAIYRVVESNPGLCLSAVGESCDVSLSTVRHHVRVLEVEALVRSVSLYGKRRYFPSGLGNLELRASLSEPEKRRVLEALARVGPARTGRLADELELDASTVSHHLTTLEAAGLVEREREGRAVLTRLSTDVAAALTGPDAERAEVEAEIAGVEDES